MATKSYNSSVLQGATWQRDFYWRQADGRTAVDVTGYTFAGRLVLPPNPATVCPVSVALISGPLGHFQATIVASDSAALRVGQTYQVLITATAPVTGKVTKFSVFLAVGLG